MLERKFDYMLGKTKLSLDVPKLKTVKELQRVARELAEGNAEIDGITETVHVILDRSGKKYTAEWIEEHLTLDEAIDLLLSYTVWVNRTPNLPN